MTELFRIQEDFTVIGAGSLGGKALGLASVKRMLESDEGVIRQTQFEINIPRLTVLATDSFDRFMDENGLWEIALSRAGDERIAHASSARIFPRKSSGILGARSNAYTSRWPCGPPAFWRTR